MSLKIYDAYKFDSTPGINALCEMADACRDKVKEAAEQIINKQILFTYLYVYHFSKLYGTERGKTMLYGIEPDSVTTLYNNCWSDAAKENWRGVYMDVCWYVKELYTVYTNTPHIFYNDYNIGCQLHLYPVDHSILGLYFGNYDLREIVEDELPISDFHYQDQTDRPEYISAQAWENRYKMWERAIGPDFIPSLHGFTIKMFVPELFIPHSKEILTKTNLPDEKELISKLLISSDYKKENSNRQGVDPVDYSYDEAQKWKEVTVQQIRDSLEIGKAMELAAQKGV